MKRRPIHRHGFAGPYLELLQQPFRLRSHALIGITERGCDVWYQRGIAGVLGEQQGIAALSRVVARKHGA
jgi:hypothetical protein